MPDVSQYFEFNLLFFVCFGTAAVFIIGAFWSFLSGMQLLGQIGLLIASFAATLGCAMQGGATGFEGWDVAMRLCMALSLLLLVWLVMSLRIRYLATRADKQMGWSEYD